MITKVLFTETQLGTVIAALNQQIRRADEKAEAAVANGRHDASDEEAFYADLRRRCESALSAISECLPKPQKGES